MNPPFKVDGDGNVTDSQCCTVGSIRATDPTVKATLIYRLNLFDDMVRTMTLLKAYAVNMPPMAVIDAAQTLTAAQLDVGQVIQRRLGEDSPLTSGRPAPLV